MKNSKWVWIVLLIVIVAIGALSAASAAAGTPGSEADPVVTKSYVDKTVKEAAEASAKSAAEAAAAPAAKAAVQAEIDTLTAKISEGLSTAGGGAFEVVNVQPGQSVIGKAGTEIIVRAGAAKAIDNGEDGVSDVTAGLDLRGGITVETNHLLLCPRDDGRGVYAASELWIMVRGDYTLQ